MPQEWGRDHMQDSTFMGLDVHKATISVAVAQGERGGEVRHWGTISHRPDHVRKLVEKLASASGCDRKGQGGRHHGYCTRDGRLHLGHRAHHHTRQRLRQPRTTAPDPFRCAGLGAEHGGELSSPVMGRQCRRPIPRPRQPQDETTVMR